MRSIRSLAGMLAAAVCPILYGQAPIRVDVQLVNLSFTVRDSRGVLVTDLGRNDFEVFEDGVPQKISFFARSADVPLALGLIADVSGSQDPFIRQHRRDLERFLKSVLGKRDQAFLVCFANRIRLASDFTGSPGYLVDALERFGRDGRPYGELGPREERVLGTAFYDSIYHSVAEKLARAETARRALVLFSDGEDNSSAYHLLDAIEAAQSAGAPIFAIRYTEPRRGRIYARNKYGIRVMDRLAVETGGRHFDARGQDMRTHFREIGEELHSSYELAYHSTNPVRDGAFRKVVVRALRPGLTVRAKTGYWAR